MESLSPKERAQEPGGGEDLLTFGEAAEFAGVSLMELRNSLRAAKVKPHWGWRGGVALQLVSLAELEALYPVLQQRRRQTGLSLAQRGILLVDPGGQAPKPQGNQRPGIHPPASKRPNTREQAAAMAAQNAADPVVLPNDENLQSLCQEIESAAVRNDKLLSEMDQTGRGIQEVLDHGERSVASAESVSKPDSGKAGTKNPGPKKQRLSLEISDPEVSEQDARKAEWERLVHQESNMQRKHRRVQWASWSVALGLMLLVAFQGKQMLFGKGGSGFSRPSQDPERADRMAQAGGESSAQPNSRPVSSSNPLVAGGPAQSPFTTTGKNGGLVSPQEAMAAPDNLPLISSGGLVSGAVAAGAPLEEEAEAMEAALSETEAQTVGVQEGILSPDQELPVLSGEEGKGYLALQFSGKPPCRFHSLTAPGQELRGVLGPCIGPWNKAEKAVAGGFRHGGHTLCRHHYSFQRDERGGIDQASKIAQYAITEGLLPPLLRLRVQHGASELLIDKVGKWLESGFGAGLSGTHKLEQLEGQDRWRVSSWVRLRKGPESTELRHFTMEICLTQDRGRDRLVSFEWVTPE